MKSRYRAAITQAALLIAVLTVLGSCAVAAGTDAGPPSPGTMSIQGIPFDAWSSLLQNGFNGGIMESGNTQYAAYLIMLFGYSNAFTLEAVLQAALANWSPDQPSTYTVDLYYSISWVHDGNSWTWTITYDNGEASSSYEVTFTASSSGWDVATSLDGLQWLTGSVSANGSQGTAVFSDPNQQYTGTVTTAWEPDQAPYAWKFTINATGSIATFAGNNATTATVILHTDTTGDNWLYDYTDDDGGVCSDEYTGGVQ